jgi:hypothetical protein
MNDQLEILELRARRRQQLRETEDMVRVLDMDANVATSQIIAALVGGKTLPAAAFQHLADKNRALAESPAEEIHDSLSRQVVILDQVFLTFMARAATATKPDHAAALAKASLNAYFASS